MNIQGLIDCHTHTINSPDGVGIPEKMVETAQELGLKAYAITDHCECNCWKRVEEYSEVNADLLDPFEIEMYNCGTFHKKSMEAFETLKLRNYGNMEFICGAELGQPLQAIDIADEICNDKGLDFIIGSLHNNSGNRDYAFLDYKNMDTYALGKLLEDYYIELLEMCKWNKFDILGHLTYPLRYIVGEQKIEVDMTRYEDIIREIFKSLIENGKGIEINTSGFWQPYGKSLPTPEHVKMFHDMGGEILSLGSDAHAEKNLGRGIDLGAEIARDCGFKYIAYFKEHKPNFVKI